ncbi:MAG: hypothetical protein COA49_05590 [Bacteroidetes bacterium]|nr:MAG: hypothetical protein COA49_05590 [Bacteroidota bacterium]
MKYLVLTLILVLAYSVSQAQVDKLSGPRIGMTVVTPGSTSDYIQNSNRPGDEGWGNSTTSVVSQYGWQLETRFADGESMVGLVEWVFLVGGMERGLFLPSISSLFGMRSEKGLEAAFGPNISLSGFGMVVAAGFTIKSDKINIPINISFVPGKNLTYSNFYYDEVIEQYLVEEIPYNTGSRISLTVGFNIVK